MFQVPINRILIFSFSDGSEISPTFGNKGKISIKIKYNTNITNALLRYFIKPIVR